MRRLLDAVLVSVNQNAIAVVLVVHSLTSHYTRVHCRVKVFYVAFC